MSSTVTTAFVNQFNRNVLMLSQQMGSKLRPYVRTENVNAYRAFFDRLSPVNATEKVTRHQDTPLTEVVHTRRSILMRDWVLAELVDREDQIRLLIDPASEYAQLFAASMGREIDRRIIAGFSASVDEGRDGSTSTAYDTTYQLTSGSAGLTFDRIRQVKKMFDHYDVDDDGRVFVVGSYQLMDLLGQTEVTNSDYNTVKALVNGDINTFMGFTWVRVSDTLLDTSGSDRICWAFQRKGVGLALGSDIKTEMDRRPDKMNALQIMTTASFNAVRIEDARVIKVFCYEA